MSNIAAMVILILQVFNTDGATLVTQYKLATSKAACLEASRSYEDGQMQTVYKAMYGLDVKVKATCLVSAKGFDLVYGISIFERRTDKTIYRNVTPSIFTQIDQCEQNLPSVRAEIFKGLSEADWGKNRLVVECIYVPNGVSKAFDKDGEEIQEWGEDLDTPKE